MRRVGFWRGTAKGVAAVEFAVASPLLLMLLAVMTDFGFLNHAQTALNAAVSAGTQYAYLTGTSVAATNIQTLVQGSAGLSGVSATVTGPACYCITGSSPSLTLASATCNGTCPDGVTTAGYYVKVKATYTYSPFFPAFALLPTLVTAQQTIQVQ